MTFLKRFLTALMLAAIGLGQPALAAADKPLVLESAKIKQLPASTTLQVNASGTGAASINIPHGTAPTSPTNGDCWTTTGGLYCRINGATVGPYGTGGGGSSITAKDEGSTLTSTVTSIDFAGAGVTATNSSGDVTVTIPASVGHAYTVQRLVNHAFSGGAVANTLINVNSTTYLANQGLYFGVDLSVYPFTHYRIRGVATSNAAGQTVTCQLATFSTPTTGIHTGGNDVTVTTSGGLDSGWLSRDDGSTNANREYGVVCKGSNSTVDITVNYMEVDMKIQ
jgi:hypothetical protein